MKWALWVLGAVAVGCHAERASVNLPPPALTVQASAVPAPLAAPPPNAAPITCGKDGSWARSFPAAKDFRVFDLAPTRRVVIAWEMGAAHKRDLDGEDYAGNLAVPTKLVVSTGDSSARVDIALGDLIGTADAHAQSYCKHRGFRLPQGSSWSIPNQADVASKLAIGTAQGDSEFLIVCDGLTLHVLHDETSDGKCEETKQGPLPTCEETPWEKKADIRLARASLDAELFETMTDAGAPFDCTVPWFEGAALSPP